MRLRPDVHFLSIRSNCDDSAWPSLNLHSESSPERNVRSCVFRLSIKKKGKSSAEFNVFFCAAQAVADTLNFTSAFYSGSIRGSECHKVHAVVSSSAGGIILLSHEASSEPCRLCNCAALDNKVGQCCVKRLSPAQTRCCHLHDATLLLYAAYSRRRLLLKMHINST